jgi:hypothetical protein
MAITEYTCIGPTRWDWIAWKAYGDPTKIAEIANENPNLEVRCLIPAGTRVVVPIIETPNAETNDLAPWKQTTNSTGVQTAVSASEILTQMLSSQTGIGSFDSSFD